MIDKTSTVQDAIKNNVNAGDNIFIGGFGHLIPFYLSHELIRQKIQDLTICRSGADILFDQLIASEIVKKGNLWLCWKSNCWPVSLIQ